MIPTFGLFMLLMWFLRPLDEDEDGNRLRRGAGSAETRDAKPPRFEPRVKTIGLGLAMVRSFVTDSGGTLKIDSTPGQGTEVRLMLPAEAGASAGDGAEAEESRPKIERGDVRVLLAEDHPLLRPMLLEAMSVAGFQVKATASAEEALEAEKDWDATILVLDVNLPGATGDTVAEAVRGRRGRDVPVIFITGNNDFEIPEWPSVELLRKPFGLADLMDLIDQGVRG